MIHKLSYKRPGSHNIHVRGYTEKGNINTPLELAIINKIDRYSLAIDAIDLIPQLSNKAAGAREKLLNLRISAKKQSYTQGTDAKEITEWIWPY